MKVLPPLDQQLSSEGGYRGVTLPLSKKNEPESEIGQRNVAESSRNKSLGRNPSFSCRHISSMLACGIDEGHEHGHSHTFTHVFFWSLRLTPPPPFSRDESMFSAKNRAISFPFYSSHFRYRGSHQHSPHRVHCRLTNAAKYHGIAPWTREYTV